jgi:ribonuclease HI
MNIDASCYEDGAGAAGAILRNDHGEAIVGSAFLLNRVIYATLAEALGLKGLKWLNKLGVSKVIIESDSLELIQACNAVIEIWSSYSAIIASALC